MDRPNMGQSWGASAHAADEQGPGLMKKGILKRPASDSPSLRRGVCSHRARRGGARVTFKQGVRVQEYRRRLDGGGTVPGDGCKMSLGLGRKAIGPCRMEPLAKAPALGQKIVEERVWVAGVHRERILRKAMGTKKYLKAWLRHRRDVQRTLRSRREAEQDEKDKFFMLSPTEAREAAKQMTAEAKKFREEHQASATKAKKPCTVSFAGCGMVGAKGAITSKGPIKAKVSFAAPKPGQRAAGEKRRRSPTPHRGPLVDPNSPTCSRCNRFINAGPRGQRCRCFAVQKSEPVAAASLLVA